MVDPAIRDALAHLRQLYERLHTNDLRNTPAGHWVNEAFVIRLYAVLEAHGVVGDTIAIDHTVTGWEDVDICRRLRNQFAHATGDIRDAADLRLEERLRAYYQFSEIPNVFQGKFSLPKDKVLRPMLSGCSRYVNAIFARTRETDSSISPVNSRGDS